MKKLIAILIPVFLSGCAGMNSEFEFNKPAKDSGYWMQQADEMTNDTNDYLSSNSASVSDNGNYNKFNVNSYKLINIPNILLPVKFANENSGSYISPAQKTSSNKLLKSESIPLDPTPEITRVVADNATISNGNTCMQKRCYQEAGEPFMTPDRVQRVWLAPYISPDDNVHIGEIVYFVSEESNWNGVEK